MKNHKIKRNILIIVVVICLAFVGLAGAGLGKIVTADILVTEDVSPAPDESFAIINIKGTIQGGNEGSARIGYDHDATMDYIDSLMEDEGNKGIFLDVDSGGGTVYHSDEMYLKLLEYKEKTGRPVHAYFNGTAASGAYYISCAADYISANKHCWTGSIGVIISTTNLSGLYEKLGIQEILITSGNNKGMGSAGSEMTDEHRAIYQAIVDESYEDFAAIVAKSRGYSDSRVREIADGRIYTARQALEAGLIDAVTTYEEAILCMEETTGTTGYYKQLYTPTPWEELLADVEAVMPKSDMAVVSELVKSELSGVPLYMYVE